MAAPPPPSSSSSSSAPETTHGSCLCGAIQYAFSGAPALNVVCHCITCQKLSGSAFQANSFVPQDAFRLLAGATHVREYRDTADSGEVVTRSFCDTCGCPVFARPGSESLREMVIIMTGTLNEGAAKAALQPSHEYFCKRRRGWVKSLGGSEMQGMT